MKVKGAKYKRLKAVCTKKLAQVRILNRDVEAAWRNNVKKAKRIFAVEDDLMLNATEKRIKVRILSDVNSDVLGEPLLHQVTFIYPKLLELCLDQPNIDINIKNDKDRTALMNSCYYGGKDIVKRLCKVPGIDFNYQDEKGYTAAMYAVESGCANILSKIPGVDWNIKTFGQCEDEWSALSLAVSKGKVDTLKMLLSIPTIDVTRDYESCSCRSIAQIAVKGFSI